MNQKTLNQRGVLMTGLLAWSYLHAIDFSALSKRKANQTIRHQSCNQGAVLFLRFFYGITHAMVKIIGHCLKKGKK